MVYVKPFIFSFPGMLSAAFFFRPQSASQLKRKKFKYVFLWSMEGNAAKYGDKGSTHEEAIKATSRKNSQITT